MDAETGQAESLRQTRADRLKTVLSRAAPEVAVEESSKRRYTSRLCQYLSDFGRWLAQPYNVDIEPPDSDDERNDGKQEEEVVQKTWREKLQTVVVSNGFEATSCLFVTVNLAFLGVQANCRSTALALSPLFLSYPDAFTTIFLIEWLLCVAAHGRSYFYSISNLLDTVIVWLFGVFLLWIAPLIFGAEGLAALQAIRAIRAMRSLRSFKVLRHFQSFRMLLTGVLGTIPTLSACILMIFLTDLTFGIISVDIIGRDPGWGLAASGTAAWYFQNGVLQASLTMSRFIFSDNAVQLIEDLQVKQPYIWIYCFLFMAIAAYVILNLVTAVICDKAQMIVNENEAEKLFEMRMEEKKNMKDLKRIFQVLDEDGSGQVTTEEFDAAFEIPECRDKFFLLGFEEEEMKQLFRVLDDDGEGELSVAEFLKGMAQVQGDCDSKSMLVATKSLEKVLLGFDKVAGSRTQKSVKPSLEDLGELVEQNLSEWLDEIESLTFERLEEIDRHVKGMTLKADGFQKKLDIIESLPALQREGDPVDEARGVMPWTQNLRAFCAANVHT